MKDGSTKKIEQVAVGDMVLSARISAEACLEKPVQHVSKVVETFRNPNPSASLAEISYSNESGVLEKIVCTANHPIWVKGKGWSNCIPNSSLLVEGQAVALLQPADEVITLKGKLGHVKKVVLLKDRYEPVYNFHVQSTHCYFANGLLVHNASDVEGIPVLPPHTGKYMDSRWNKEYGTGPGKVFWTGDLSDGRDRGPSVYSCPVGWKKYGVMLDGLSGDQFDQRYAGWPVAYHGTATRNAPSILAQGFMGGRGCFDDGQTVVYFSPSIRYCAHPRYAQFNPRTQAHLGGKNTFVQMVFQVRINPDFIMTKGHPTIGDWQLETVDPEHDPNTIEWVVSTKGRKFLSSKDIFVCYAIMIREIDHHPFRLPETRWWGDEWGPGRN
jgi:hypothetical protein